MGEKMLDYTKIVYLVNNDIPIFPSSLFLSVLFIFQRKNQEKTEKEEEEKIANITFTDNGPYNSL